MEAAKERFAGANTLALPLDVFEQDYPTLAKDIAHYASFIPSKNKKTKYILASRLLLKLLEEDPKFHGLRDFLREPNARVGKPENFDEILKLALKESYERLLASGLYSPAIAFEHAQNGVAVFRWLGAQKQIYPRLPKALPLKTWKRKGPRRSKDIKPPFQPMEIGEIESVLGDVFVEDLKAFQNSSGRFGAQRVLGFRYLISYIKDHPSGHSDALLGALAGNPDAVCDAAAIKAVIEECEGVLRRSGAFSQQTIAGWMRSCGYLFEFLCGLHGRTYPHYSRRYKKFTYVPAESGTLADLDFPEIKGLVGAAKLRRALELVCDAAMDVVRRHASFFDSMAPMREDRVLLGITKEKRAACNAIATVLRAELRSIRLTGNSQFSKSGVRSNGKAVDRAMKALASPDTWREAGAVNLVPVVETLSFQQIMQLVCACIGASHQAALAAKIVFCCEAGWNRQPIEDIPPEVFVFRLVDEAGVASASFVSVFKNRAGHFVQAFLEYPVLTGGRKTNALATWEEAEREQVWGDFDQRCMLSYTSPAYVALELMRPLMEPLNDLTKDEEVRRRFFKYLGWNTGVSWSQRDIAGSFEPGTLSTRGLTFPLIRKTFLQLMLRVVGSVESLRTHAGHAGTGVLLSHYLNSPDVKRELEQSTRFFQNAVQALIVSDVGGSLQLVTSEEDQEWFYNLARISGVASAVGYDVSTPVAGPPALVFDLTDEQVRGLLAVGMSLDAEEKTANPRRWALVGVPLRGFIKAVVTNLKAAGASRLLKRIGEELANDVREGRVALPPLSLSGGYK
ncbi:hypothetical protein I6F07_05590 [Ensifer sp. IC4062]|nr:hypothetical protein [Ensifer sp. IC4062]MCA1439704.1 hypothetical protein [Ensifer sp. IC4062]